MSPAELLHSIDTQALWCEKIGAPMYARLLRGVSAEMRADADRSGALWRMLDLYPRADVRSLLPTRFLSALHWLVLAGEMPEIRKWFPSVGGVEPPETVWPAALGALERSAERIREVLPATVQTNEIGRSRALLPGFLYVAEVAGLPLRLLEIGASAGLNLAWDRYRYWIGDTEWGDPASPVELADEYAKPWNPPEVRVRIHSRQGCDLHPIDPVTPQGRAQLLSFVWPEKTERFRQLDAAIRLRQAGGVTPAIELEQAGAADWVARKLTELPEGVATVLFHSVMLPYLSDPDQEQVRRLLSEAGERATGRAPVAWLSMEPEGGFGVPAKGQETEREPVVDLVLWRGRGPERVRVATTSFHGTNVDVLL